MKISIKLPAIVLGLMLLLTGTTQRLMAQDEDVSLQTFYDELSPYGTWIQDQEYGYVWRPDVDQNEFRPYYTNGRWAMTEYGNTWVSDYDWGWAPFHYGRWVTNRYNQWLWIPDTTWGPAWVSWRSGGGYYGWAPLGPSMGVSLNFGFSIPDLWWCFVPQANIYFSSFPRYYPSRNYGIIHRTNYITNVYVHNRSSYYTGPRRDDIRRDTHQDVRVYNINRTERPGRGGISDNNINIYTPRGGRGSSNAGNPAPRNVSQGSVYTANRGGRSADNDNRDHSQGRGNNAVRPVTQGTDRGAFGTPGNTSRAPRTNINGERPQPDAQRSQRVVQTQEQRQQHQQQFEQQRQQREAQGQSQQRQEQQRQQTDQQRQQQAQQQREQSEQRQQQQSQQRQQQVEQQRQQREAQNQQRQEQQRQQADQQRQQQAEQQRQQREAQNQQRQEQQRQQADQQRQQQAQQRQEQQQQQRSSDNRSSGEGRGGRSGRN